MIKLVNTLMLLLIFVFINAQEDEEILDHFDGNSGNWVIAEHSHKKSELKEGKFIIESNIPKKIQTFLKDQIIDPKDDYRIEAKLTKTSGAETDAY